MSAAVAAAASAAVSRRSSATTTTSRSNSESFYGHHMCRPSFSPKVQVRSPLISRYECQKRRDWNNFRQYLRDYRPTLSVSSCSGAIVVEFLCYLDEFGQTKVHSDTCTNFGHLYAAESCSCPVRQAWSSLVGLIGRLRVAFEENGGNPVKNPFNAVDVRIYLNEIKGSQDKSKGIDE